MSFIQNSQLLFIYLGIFFFITHYLVYGSGIDISYFGLFLIFVGYFKMQLYNWVYILLWIFIAIEFINLGKKVYNYFYKKKKQRKKRKNNWFGLYSDNIIV
jgi:hypothetical protein